MARRDDRTEAERFWQKVDRRGPDECWPWTGAKNPSGHGRFWLDPIRRNTPSHRYSYEELVGPIPEGLHLDHLCQNPGCVNPAHCEPVSLWENLRRSPNQVAVLNSMKTHCHRGHEFTEDNTYRFGNHRACKMCSHLRYLESKGVNV